MKQLFLRIYLAISSLSFYRQVIQEPFSWAVKFYLGFLLVLALSAGLFYWTYLHQNLRQLIKNTGQAVNNHFPAELIISWNQTSYTMNQEKVVVPYPEFYPWFLPKDGKHLLTIQAAEEIVIPESMYVVTPTKLNLVKDGKVYSSQNLNSFIQIDQIEVNSSTISTVSDQVSSVMFSVLALLGLLFPFLVFVLMLLIRAYFFLLEATMGYIFLRLLGSRFTLNQVGAMTLYIFIPAELVNLAVTINQWQAPFSFFSLTFWIYFICIVLYLNRPTVLFRQS